MSIKSILRTVNTFVVYLIAICCNITHSQDLGFAVSLQYNRGRETALPCPLYHSGAAGIDIIPKKDAIFNF